MESKAINRYTNHRHIANKTDSVFVRNRIKLTVRSPRNLRSVVCTRPVAGSLLSPATPATAISAACEL